jgi:5-methylcytosine-specific restriction endonuclease McrA
MHKWNYEDNQYKHFLKKSIKKKECCICGIKKGLELHHKIPTQIGGNNLPDNVIFLCNKHHIELHKPVNMHYKLNPTARWYLKRIGELRKKYRKD